MKKLFVICCLLGFLLNATAQTKIVVAQDGSGNVKTVQAALRKVPVGNKKPMVIFIKNGVYKEKLHLDSGRNFVTMVGEDRFKTIITFDDHTGKKAPDGSIINTQTSYTFRISADDFSAMNLTVENNAGFTAGQAVGLEVRGDKAVFLNCRIVGNQDILFLNSERSNQYFKNCYIEGTTDFIFGAATAWFERCHIHSKKESHITAASTPANHAFGFIFNDCVLTGDSSLHKVSLGRPWRPYANVIYMRSYIGGHIMSAGWSAWNKLESYRSSRYAEYKNYGPGASTASRVDWSRQLTDIEAKGVTLKKVFSDWDIQSRLLMLEGIRTKFD